MDPQIYEFTGIYMDRIYKQPVAVWSSVNLIIHTFNGWQTIKTLTTKLSFILQSFINFISLNWILFSSLCIFFLYRERTNGERRID